MHLLKVCLWGNALSQLLERIPMRHIVVAKPLSNCCCCCCGCCCQLCYQLCSPLFRLLLLLVVCSTLGMHTLQI